MESGLCWKDIIRYRRGISEIEMGQEKRRGEGSIHVFEKGKKKGDYGIRTEVERGTLG